MRLSLRSSHFFRRSGIAREFDNFEGREKPKKSGKVKESESEKIMQTFSQKLSLRTGGAPKCIQKTTKIGQNFPIMFEGLKERGGSNHNTPPPLIEDYDER